MTQQPSHIGRSDRYEIKTLIGAGGMGALYLARDTNPNTNRLVAVKLLNATLDSTEMRQRFDREARSLSSLSHPNIVGIFDSGEFQGSPFIVMEYIRGETLAEKIKRKAPLTLEQKLKLMVELCSGLAHAHEAGIIHRDIKPANLMVDQHGRLRILDFGIARAAEGTRFNVQVTQLNVQIGTPGYMAPEQIDGSEVDRRSDIFAAGAVCYALLAYREAFTGTNTRQIERQVLEARPPRLSSLVPDLEPAIEEIVNKAMARNPAERYQDAAAFEADLERERWLLETPGQAAKPLAPVVRESGTDSRAEAAYQRALAAHAEGAVAAARRFAIEALAEDPEHRAARAFIERLGANQWPPPPPLPGKAAGPAPSMPGVSERTWLPGGTIITSLAGAAGRTVLDGEGARPPAAHQRPSPGAARPPLPRGAERTSLPGSTQGGSYPGATSRTIVDDPAAPTILVSSPFTRAPETPPPTIVEADVRAPARPQVTVEGRSRGKGAVPAAATAKAQAAPARPRRAGLRSKVPLVAAAVLGVLAVVGLGAWLAIRFWPQGMTLTIERPTGGTVRADGIACGSQGADCTANFSPGTSLLLEPVPDEGWSFGGFGGGCSANGLVLISGPVTCTATFTRQAEAPPAAVTYTLTIVKPTNGTIVGPGTIRCGPRDDFCTGEFAEGTLVELRAMPDQDFVAGGFSGDCVTKSGNTAVATMTGARRCAASFVAGQSFAARQPATPPPSGPARGGASRGREVDLGAGAVAGLPPPQPGGVDVDPLAPKPKDDAAKVAAPTPPEELAKQDIIKLLEEYRKAWEKMDTAAIRRVWPTAPVAALDTQFRLYKSLKYTLEGAPEFDTVDPTRGIAHAKAKFVQIAEDTARGVQPPNKTEEEFELEKREGVWRIAKRRVQAAK